MPLNLVCNLHDDQCMFTYCCKSVLIVFVFFHISLFLFFKEFLKAIWTACMTSHQYNVLIMISHY